MDPESCLSVGLFLKPAWEGAVPRGYSSVVEHLTADQEVPGSTPGAPFGWDFSREKYEEHSSVFDPLCTDGRSLFQYSRY